MRLTIVHPCIGRRRADRYIKSWQMEPLAPALLAGLTPRDVSVRFYDDRMETIPFDEPTDIVAMSVETYTAKRSYQIASEYRRRGIPVIFGGFHPTLVPDEAERYAESIVVGEAENVWRTVLRDFAAGRLRRRYHAGERPSLSGLSTDRRIFAGKRYLPIALVEAGRGCHFRCEFCAVQSYFKSTQTRRPTEEVIDEIRRARKPLVFFVDDNITSNMDRAKELFHALIPLKIRWVSQSSINAAHDLEFLELLRRSGCQGVLIGFETLDRSALKRMRKGFNTMGGGYEVAMANLRRYGIRLYGTFIVGYDGDHEGVEAAVDFALREKMYIAAFNHLTPFPGTPLYARLAAEGRLRFERWWLDPGYRYGMVPYHPQGATPDEITRRCIAARRRFYSLRSIARRGFDLQVNGRTPYMWAKFFGINWMLRREVTERDGYPLGDERFSGELLEVNDGRPALVSAGG